MKFCVNKKILDVIKLKLNKVIWFWFLFNDFGWGLWNRFVDIYVLISYEN